MISVDQETSEEAIVEWLEDGGFVVEYRESQDRYHVEGHESDLDE